MELFLTLHCIDIWLLSGHWILGIGDHEPWLMDYGGRMLSLIGSLFRFINYLYSLFQLKYKALLHIITEA